MENKPAEVEAKRPGAKRPAWFRYLFNFRFFSDDTPKISPQSVVDPSAQIADDVEIGPFCVIGAEVKIGPGCKLLNSVTVVGQTTIGRDNIFFPNSVMGTAPQDKKYKGAPTRLEIGNGNAFREMVTIHCGTEKGGGVTTIGDNNLFMVNSHVGHDCRIGSHCVVSNNSMIAGHVLIGDYVALMGGAGVHHFVTIGTHAYIGGYARVHHDVPPFVKVDGADQIRGLNKVGLTRAGYTPEDVRALDGAYRRLFLKKRPLSVAMAEFGNTSEMNAHVRELVDFLRRRDQGKHGRHLESLRNRPAADAAAVAAVAPEGSASSNGEADAAATNGAAIVESRAAVAAPAGVATSD